MKKSCFFGCFSEGEGEARAKGERREEERDARRAVAAAEEENEADVELCPHKHTTHGHHNDHTHIVKRQTIASTLPHPSHTHPTQAGGEERREAL